MNQQVVTSCEVIGGLDPRHSKEKVFARSRKYQTLRNHRSLGRRAHVRARARGGKLPASSQGCDHRYKDSFCFALASRSNRCHLRRVARLSPGLEYPFAVSSRALPFLGLVSLFFSYSLFVDAIDSLFHHRTILCALLK